MTVQSYFFDAVSQEILDWCAGLANGLLSSRGFSGSIEDLCPAVKLGEMRLLLKTRCRPTGSGPAQPKTQATWRGENRDTLCLPCSLPVTSFTGSQHPALNYCVSWCISLLWLQTFCRVKHGRITITVAPGALLALETFPQEVICHIVFTSYQLRQERRKKEGLYNCTSEHRLGGKKYIFWFWNPFSPFKKACRESGVLSQVVSFTVDRF